MTNFVHTGLENIDEDKEYSSRSKTRHSKKLDVVTLYSWPHHHHHNVTLGWGSSMWRLVSLETRQIQLKVSFLNIYIYIYNLLYLTLIYIHKTTSMQKFLI